jgi:hypothetical protein
MDNFGFAAPDDSSLFKRITSDFKKVTTIYDSYSVACSHFGNLLSLLTGDKKKSDYLCSNDFKGDLAKSLVPGQKKSSAMIEVFSAVRKNQKKLSDCMKTKIRERGADVSELKVRTCVGHVAPDVAGSYQRDFNGATLVAEALGYVSIFRRIKPDSYRTIFETLCSAVNCKAEGKFFNFMALDSLFGERLADPKYFWRKGYSPIPIIVWDGVFDDGGRPSVSGWEDQNNIPPSHAVFLGGKATFYDTAGRNRGGECGNALLSQLICHIAYPSRDRRYSGRVGPEGGWSWGYLPWVIPPPKS